MISWRLFSRKSKADPDAWDLKSMFGPNLNFAATEAYKLLRTKLISLPTRTVRLVCLVADLS